LRRRKNYESYEAYKEIAYIRPYIGKKPKII